MARTKPARIIGQLLPLALLSLLCGGCGPASNASPPARSGPAAKEGKQPVAKEGKQPAAAVQAPPPAPADERPAPSPHWVRVRVEWPGAARHEIEQRIVAAVEFMLEPLPEVDEIVSVARQHEALVWARIPGRVARQTARRKVAGVVGEIGLMPVDVADAEVAPVAAGPILLVALRGQDGEAGAEGAAKTKAAQQLQSAASKLAALLERNEHVAEVLVVGEQRLRLEISVDPQKLAARGLTADDVAQAVEKQFIDVRQVEGKVPEGDVIVRSVAGDVSEEQLSQIVLAVRDGTPVLVRDVAEVRLRLAAPLEAWWEDMTPRPDAPAGLDGWVLLGVHVDAPLEAERCAAAVTKSLATFEPPPGVRVVRDLREERMLLQLAADAWADSIPPYTLLKHAASAEWHSHFTLAKPDWTCRVTGNDIDALHETAAAVEQLLGEHQEVKSLRAIGTSISRQMHVGVDRERCRALGIATEAVARALLVDDRWLATAKLRGQPVDITMVLGDADQTLGERIADLRVRSEAGNAVPLAAVSQIRMVEGPAAIWRIDGQRFAEVCVELNDDAAGVGAELEERLAPLRAQLKQAHPEFRLEFPGGD